MVVRKQLKGLMRRLYESQRGKCHYCDRLMILDGTNHKYSATKDHRDPIVNGGRHVGNIVLACGRCNELKADMTEAQFVLGIACAGGVDEFEQACIRSRILGAKSRNRRRKVRQKAFFEPETLVAQAPQAE